jgi:hypothetical protein
LNPATKIATTSAGRLVSRDQLKPDELRKMYCLLCEHFDGVTIEQFHRDIADKNWIVLVERGARLVGFSTILAYETCVNGQTCSVIYSGDTIVASEGWNSSTLPRAWIESVASLRRLYPRGPYVWLLLTSGFRTYRYLPLFWCEFFPRFDSQTPAHGKNFMDALALARFGPQYHLAEGIVRFENPQCLRGPLAVIPSGREADPHVAFFAARNPGYVDGDELVCITELSPRNLTSAGRRMASAIPRWCQW